MKSRYLFLLSFLAIIFFRQYPIILSAVLILVIFMLLYKKPKEDFYLFLFGFILGPIVEFICIKADAWSYKPNDILFLNFGFYLPLAWGLTGLCFLTFYRKIKKNN